MLGNFKKVIKVSSLSFIACLIVFYSIYQARFIIEGPKVSIWDPQNGSTVSKSVLDIKGEAKNIARLSLDGRQIFVNEQGSFKERVLLSEGFNEITISAQDKFGRETQKIIGLFFKGAESSKETLTKK